MIAVRGPALPPEEAARRLAALPGAFWLCGPAVDDEARVGRDMVGASPVRVVRGERAGTLEELEDAWHEERARWRRDGGDVTPGVPIGVGWLSYDLGHELLRLPGVGRRAHGWPPVEFHFHDAVWVRDDGAAATIFAADEAAAARLAAALDRPPPAELPEAPRLGPLTAAHEDARYLAGVRRVLEYLLAGDAYQVNVSRRLRADCPTSDAVALAAALRRRAPAPYGALIAGGDGETWLVGNSPERFLAVGDPGAGAVETRPIKGTRPRGDDVAADRAAAEALATAEKDRAEHVMIVDLERNDLGRVCRTGSVEVAGGSRVISLPTVHHLVTTVRGRLRADVGLAALLGATFPGGSITGAPKRRAVEIIAELEPEPRGPYTGATGWLGAAGDLDFAVAIRTALVRDGVLSLSVGGGVVADSTPEGELAETNVKAQAFAALARGSGANGIPS